ncbi:MAG: AMP-binding protein [Treponema sp.]|nr:AMP-binding protein [Treponema sp.]
MAKKQIERKPFEFLKEYKGRIFNGEWPTLPELFTITTERHGDRNCFTDFEGPGGSRNTLTYRQAYEKIVKLSIWMNDNGIKKGDIVAVSGKNAPEWTVVYLATLFAGATITPLDYALHNSETENLLNAAKPKLFFVDSEKYEYFAAKKGESYKTYSLSPKYADTYAYNLEPKAGSTLNNNKVQEDDVAAILFTSGTTGTPKGVMLTHKNLVSDAFIAQTCLDIYPTDVFYAILPIHHAYTMLAVFIITISTGAELVFGKSMAVTRLMKELKEGRITMLLGVPLLFNKLLDGILKGIKAKGPFVNGLMHMLMGLSYLIKKITGKNIGKKLFKAVLEKASIATLRVAICGGGPLAASVFKTYNELGLDFIQGYGLTETSPIITLNPIENFKIESVGRYFYPYMEMKILDPDEKGIGEVCCKGPMVMKGYYNMPEETAKVFTEDGWFKTGDLGWLDSEGYLMLCGRAKNMIVTAGGKNVYPEEIENAFQLEYDIEQITVQGFIADAALNSEEIEALIYPADGCYEKCGCAGKRGEADADAKVLAHVEEIVSKINKGLQPYARITKITILEQPLEMTTTKKVKRIYKK